MFHRLVDEVVDAALKLARHLLKWLRDDGLLKTTEAEQLAKRFGQTDSSLHPLARLGGAGLLNLQDGQPLDTEALTRWLAARYGLSFQRIDPLRVDASRVADVMSLGYAETRKALPVAYGPTQVMRSGPSGYPLSRRNLVNWGTVFHAPVDT